MLSLNSAELFAFFGGTDDVLTVAPVANLSKGGEIGSQAMADKALEISRSNNRYAPEDGWTYLGEGISRIAFLAPDGIVYKVSTGAYATANETEYNTFLSLSPHLPKNVRLARCAMWGAKVNAMEYCGTEEVETDGYWGPVNPIAAKGVRQLKEISAKVSGNRFGGLTDLHSGNVRIVNGVLVAIDYAM